MSKNIIITGCSSGIGKSAALLFAQKGWNVAATMRSPEKETELIKHPNIQLFKLDVTDAENVKSTFKEIISKFGSIDVLVNNAGYGLVGPVEAASEEKIYRQFNTNLFGSIRTIQEVLPNMRENKSGVIINITSIGGLITLPFNALYHATKFALDGLSESLNYELSEFNIQVKTVAPGGVATDFASRSLDSTITTGEQTPYDASLQKVWDAFMSRLAVSAPELIAEVIYKAATDGSKQLRYLAGEDANRMYGDWKNMSNEEFYERTLEGFNLN